MTDKQKQALIKALFYAQQDPKQFVELLSEVMVMSADVDSKIEEAIATHEKTYTHTAK